MQQKNTEINCDLSVIGGQLINLHFSLEVYWTEMDKIGMATLPIIDDIFNNSRLGFLTDIVSFSMN